MTKIKENKGTLLFKSKGIVSNDIKLTIEVKRYEISDNDVYSYPVISGNRLFIKDAEALSLWLFE